MKKSFLSIVTLITVAMMLVFASCTKDGVYKPKKKISKIYETVQTDPNPERILKETWTWDGKLLSKVDYGDGAVVSFKYDKNQLVAITSGDSRSEFNYDSKGKYIDNVKCYDDNDLIVTYTFTHNDKNLISGYEMEYNGGLFDKNCVRLVENVFRFLAPEIAQNEAQEFVKNANSNLKGDHKYKVEFTYDGKNIIGATTNDGETYTYTYTEYKNPFYGLLSEWGIEGFSKNAVASYVRKVDGMPDYNYTYTYQVDGKVPTQATENFSWTISMGGINSSHTETTVTDYEYLK